MLDRTAPACRAICAALLICAATWHCSTPGSSASGSRKATDVPLVFIPGLMGSLLADSTGATRWLTALQGLGLSTPNLGLPLTWTGDRQDRDSLEPAGIVMDVSLIPGLVEQQVYRPWADFAAGIPGRPLHIFSYDWRRDNNESALRFEVFLEDLRQRYGGRRIQVVAHSMGGLISLSVMNRRPELFDRIVFVGVPFRGGVGYLDNMFEGTPIGRNEALLAAEVIFSHTSVYSFYPAGQDFENKDVARDASGQPLRLDFYDPATWRAEGLGPFAPESAPWRGNPEKRFEFLAKVLERGRVFRRSLRPARPAAQYPPALVIGSRSYDTLSYMQKRADSPDGIPGGWDFANTARERGDSTVLYRDMLPPEPIRHRSFLSGYSHSYLLNDPAAQREIARFLLQADRKQN